MYRRSGERHHTNRVSDKSKVAGIHYTGILTGYAQDVVCRVEKYILGISRFVCRWLRFVGSFLRFVLPFLRFHSGGASFVLLELPGWFASLEPSVEIIGVGVGRILTP